MTKEEAIRVMKDTYAHWLRLKDEDILPCSECEKVTQAIDMAIKALSAEPIERTSDNTIVVKYADYEDIGRIILTNGDIFCKMFYEDARQNDDSDYDSLVPDEHKTEPSDLISRADAIEAVAQEWLSEASAESPYVNDDDIGEYRKLAEKLFEDIPSADRPTMIPIELEKRYPNSEDEDITDAFMRGYQHGRTECDRPSGEWIPLIHDTYMTTNFPHDRDGQWVIVTDGKCISVERIKKDAYDHFYPNGRWFELEHTTAWMPLPQPYGTKMKGGAE